jgi:hypothetical protein
MAFPNAPTDHGPLVAAADARPSQYWNEPPKASTRLVAAGDEPFFSTILMTPPMAPSP